MSSHADTIRDYVTNTERYDGQWHRLPTDDETVAALDALLAENQRLREALERIAPIMEQWADPPPRGVRAIATIAREALAGDGE